MAEDRVCPRCAEPIPAADADCPYCGGRKAYPLLHRESVLIAAILALALVLWLVTHGVTQAYAHREDHLARSWYASGDTALRTGRVEESISDLRTALAYAHDDTKVRLRLAEALATAGQTRQAQAYLLALWEEAPADGNFNLQLARLAVRTGNIADAQRYYHGAIYGVWNEDPVSRRRLVRLELIRLLVARQATQQAESELIALSADVPSDAKWKIELGSLFLQTGDANRALGAFGDVVRQEPRNAQALAGAGQAAFQQQDYSLARRYLERARSLDSKDAPSAELLQTTEQVLQMDPFVSRIGRDERARRVLRAFEQTRSRMEKCAEQKGIVLSAPSSGPLTADYQEFDALSPRIGIRALRNDPDLTDAAMQLIFRSQDDAASECGQPQGPDLALLLIGRKNGGGR